MKRKLISLTAISGLMLSFLPLGCGKESHDAGEFVDLYTEIDNEIENSSRYDEEKEKRIEDLKKKLAGTTNAEMQKELTDWLITEYEAYISDSALYYVNRNLENPIVKGNKRLETALTIKKADIAAHAGLFGESDDLLASINASDLDSTLLESYYSAYCDLYQYQSEYNNSNEFVKSHEKLREIYIDSISMVAPPTSFNYLMNYAAKAARGGDFKTAEDLLKENLDKYLPGDRHYSILASILADIYKQQGDTKNYREYICKSVVSDIKGAVKENMAIRALATECFQDGDLERADRYLRRSFEDANFYSARMRNAQSSRMLPIIGEAYTQQQKKLNKELRLFIIFISILAFGFVLISIFAFLQVKKIRKVNKKTKETLLEVSKLSEKLSKVNEELKTTNKELQASNKIRSEYGALFMEYSALAISALQQYQQSLKVAAVQGNMNALIKKIESASIENKTLAEFYSKFDEAILNIYPNFVDKFNDLLKEGEHIELKPNESLNTELRVFALIKIGITDSEKIAKFLRCSLSTVYTYRSKMKKKAKDPENFEKNLLET